MKLVWLPRALADRDTQLDFIAQDKPLAAIEQGDRIAEQIGHLIAHPLMGRVGRRPGTRELVVNRTLCIVVYRVKGERIELLPLLRGSQQWP